MRPHSRDGVHHDPCRCSAPQSRVRAVSVHSPPPRPPRSAPHGRASAPLPAPPALTAPPRCSAAPGSRSGAAPVPLPVPLPVRAAPPLARLRSAPCPRRLRWELPRHRAERGSGEEEGEEEEEEEEEGPANQQPAEGRPLCPVPSPRDPLLCPDGGPTRDAASAPSRTRCGGERKNPPKDLGRVWETPPRTPHPTARNERRRVAASLGAQGWLGRTRVDKHSALQNEIFKTLCQH